MYKVSHFSENSVILKPTSRSFGCMVPVVLFFLIFPLGALIIGSLLIGGDSGVIYGWENMKDEDAFLSGLAMICAGFSVSLFLIGGLIQQWNSFKVRPQMYFDKKNASLTLSIKKRTVSIPFSDILGMGVKEWAHGYSTNWIVYMLKTDGAMWRLISFARRSKAEQTLTRLRLVCENKTHVQRSLPEKLPERIHIDDSGENIDVIWQSRLVPSDIPMMLALILAVGSIGYFYPAFIEDMSIIMQITLPILFLFLFLALLFYLRNLLGRYHLIINKELVETYFNFWGAKLFRKTRAIENLASLVVVPDEKNPYGEMELYSQYKLNNIQELMDNPVLSFSEKISRTWNVITDRRSLRLKLNSLDIVDKVLLEEALQQVIKDKFQIELK